jgi:RNA polymerase sigma factor (sigma-70 family)
MTDSLLWHLLRCLRHQAGPEGGTDLTDTELLRRFVARRDAAAFEALVWRHAAMVLGVCRRVLRHAADVEDAFQATFLVFLRMAGSIRSRQAVAGWLYQVAYRTALRSRRAAARRLVYEKRAVPQPPASPALDDTGPDLRPLLDEELNRLPAKYRAPVVLCYLEGHSKEKAARALGCPEGTVSSRLARARRRLQRRLLRRGVALSAVGLGTLIHCEAAPAELVRSTLHTAMVLAAGGSWHAAGVSAPVAALATGVLHRMFAVRLAGFAAVLTAIGLFGTGSAALIHAAFERPPHADRTADTAALSPGGKKSEAPKDSASDPVTNPPGWIWAVQPQDTRRTELTNHAGVKASLRTDPDGSLVVTMTHPPRYSRAGRPYYRPVAFDSAGRRYLFTFAAGQFDDRVAVNCYRLPHRLLPAGKVDSVGIEELPPAGRKPAAEYAARLARARGIDTLALPEVGKEYDFTLTAAGGRVVRGREMRGKVVVIQCWAAWHPGSVAQRVRLAARYDRWRARGLEVIGIDLNHAPGPAGQAAAGLVHWPEVLVPRDLPDRELWEQASEILALPRVLLLDRHGILRADTPHDLDEAITRLLH